MDVFKELIDKEFSKIIFILIILGVLVIIGILYNHYKKT